MTVYISETPYYDQFTAPIVREANELPHYHLWADDPLEAEIFLYSLAIDPNTCKRPFTSWKAWGVTAETMAMAIARGAQLTDWLGPREWLARKEQRPDALIWIAAARLSPRRRHAT